MLHPFMTSQLVRQGRAALEPQPRNMRPVPQIQPRARADAEPGRFGLTARTFARRVRALVARAT
jgi:hypothetical protein